MQWPEQSSSLSSTAVRRIQLTNNAGCDKQLSAKEMRTTTNDTIVPNTAAVEPLAKGGSLGFRYEYKNTFRREIVAMLSRH